MRDFANCWTLVLALSLSSSCSDDTTTTSDTGTQRADTGNTSDSTTRSTDSGSDGGDSAATRLDAAANACAGYPKTLKMEPRITGQTQIQATLCYPSTFGGTGCPSMSAPGRASSCGAGSFTLRRTDDGKYEVRGSSQPTFQITSSHGTVTPGGGLLGALVEDLPENTEIMFTGTKNIKFTFNGEEVTVTQAK